MLCLRQRCKYISKLTRELVGAPPPPPRSRCKLRRAKAVFEPRASSDSPLTSLSPLSLSPPVPSADIAASRMGLYALNHYKHPRRMIFPRSKWRPFVRRARQSPSCGSVRARVAQARHGRCVDVGGPCDPGTGNGCKEKATRDSDGLTKDIPNMSSRCSEQALSRSAEEERVARLLAG